MQLLIFSQGYCTYVVNQRFAYFKAFILSVYVWFSSSMPNGLGTDTENL